MKIQKAQSLAGKDREYEMSMQSRMGFFDECGPG